MEDLVNFASFLLKNITGKIMDLLDLPYTLFAEIISYLAAVDVIRCQRLCHRAHAALTRQELCISLILGHFPRSREGRLLREQLRDDHVNSGDFIGSRDWAAVFARLARRYLHLGAATPWRTLKLETLKEYDSSLDLRLRGVTPWNRFLRLDTKTAQFHHCEPTWTFDAQEGLLVYPSLDGLGYQARDVATGEQVSVPFDWREKVVRRVRLAYGVLVVEWCESVAYHALNERERAHRHFATVFDVKRRGDGHSGLPRMGRDTGNITNPPPSSSLSLWDIKFRSEIKIHYLGLPLSAQDRFFSTHNATHYVVYIWQPTRSPWGEDDPLERLTIWEFGDPSPYRPSLDPGEKFRPSADDNPGPRVVQRLINHELSPWGIRQSDTPSLRGLYLDGCTWDEHSHSACGHIFFHEEEHRWSAGPHSSTNLPRLHRVRSTGIPLQGEGPRWEDDCGGADDTVGFCWRGPRQPSNSSNENDNKVSQGFYHSASNDMENWPGRAPCWRHDDFPYLTVAEAYDSAAGVRVSARHCFMLETLSVHVRPKLRVAGAGWGCAGTATKVEGPEGDEVQFGEEWWAALLGKGALCGDERWLVGEDEEGDITVMLF